MLDITRKAAEFVAGLNYPALPRQCVDAARTGIADCIGVMIAGFGEEAVRIVSMMASGATKDDSAPEIVSGRTLTSSDAALVNGVAAHVLDYDDVALAGHPSAVLVPAILAEGWTLDAGGKRALTAYVAGYELWAQLIDLEPGRLHDRGFHPTAVMGAVATAAACASLRGLDAGKTRHAIGIGASLASGLVANFGSMTKSLHVGRSAQSGVLAARLAAAGFTASPDVLEHRSGFLWAHSPSGAPHTGKGASNLGIDWRLARDGVNVKRYPTCYATHRAIDAMLSLVADRGLTAREVCEIHVRTGETQKMMLRNSRPKNGLEAKFSMEFAMAAALVAGKVGLAELDNAFVARTDVGEIMAKVRCTTTDEMMAGDQPFAPDDRVRVVLRSQEEIECPPVMYAKGSWQQPLSADELREKFIDCAMSSFERVQASRLFDQLWSIEHQASLRGLDIVAA